ncbi:biopolymer transporter ExbD [Oligoflexia bacterium]|nr:biopolymer transporter ExbD [Oligoflexia bacterium]
MDFSGGVKLRAGLNIMPLIDVVFILLIFFMLTSTFYLDEGIQVELPSSQAMSQTDNPSFTVSINRAGEIFLGKGIVSYDVLKQQTRSFLADQPQGAIIIRSDAAVQVQTLISVMDNLQQAGAQNITMATVDGT